MMMMMISGWISLEFLIDNYIANHPSDFLSLLPLFSAGYTKFRLTNCFHNVENSNTYTPNVKKQNKRKEKKKQKKEHFVLLLPKVKINTVHSP